MEWVVFVVLSALFAVLLSYLQKRYADSYTALEASFLSTLYALPITILVTLIVGPDGLLLTENAVAASLLSGVLNVVALLAYQRALSVGALSVVAPFASVTPLLTALFQPLVTETGFNPVVVVASGLVVLGAAISLSTDGLDIDSFKRQDIGLALIASALYAVAAIANTRATATTDPTIVVVIIYAVMVAGFFILLWYQSSPLLSHPLTAPIHVGFGATYAFLSLALFAGYATAPSAAHVTTVRKLSVIGTVFVGVYVFSEENLIQRLVGSALIIIGVLLVSV